MCGELVSTERLNLMLCAVDSATLRRHYILGIEVLLNMGLRELMMRFKHMLVFFALYLHCILLLMLIDYFD